jgi:putative glutathione S-transferase
MADYKYKINDLDKAIQKSDLAESQAEYEAYFNEVFSHLDDFDNILKNQKYLGENEISEDDIDLYKILIKFDIIYYFAFKLNKKHIWEYPNLFRLEKELYNNEITAKYNDLDAIKKYFYEYRTTIKNPYHIVHRGGDPRDRF